MKQSILKKLLASGVAAFGILGLSTPAAFAWSGNSSNGDYGNSNNHKSYSSGFDSQDSHKNFSPCYKVSSWNGNMYGNTSDGCRNMNANHRNKCDGNNNYGTNTNTYGEMGSSYSNNRW